MSDKYIHLEEGEEFTFADARKAFNDGVPTYLIPCFLSTLPDTYIKGVLQKCGDLIATSETYVRVYLLFQEGISDKKATAIFEELRKHGDSTLPHSDKVQVFSFSNIETDILLKLCDAARGVERIDTTIGGHTL